jgi:hypothetical protein
MSHEIHRVVAGHVDSRIEAEIAEAMRVATAPGLRLRLPLRRVRRHR